MELKFCTRDLIQIIVEMWNMYLFDNETNNERSKYAHDSASCVGESHQNASEIRSDVDMIAIAATTKLGAVKNLSVRMLLATLVMSIQS